MSTPDTKHGPAPGQPPYPWITRDTRPRVPTDLEWVACVKSLIRLGYASRIHTNNERHLRFRVSDESEVSDPTYRTLSWERAKRLEQGEDWRQVMGLLQYQARLSGPITWKKGL